jgi:hypothetical protein
MTAQQQPELPEDAKVFLKEVEEFQQSILKKYDGAIGIAVVVNWDKAHDGYPKCVLETDPEKTQNMNMQTPAVAMHDLLVNSGGALLRQLLDHSVQQIVAAQKCIIELKRAAE